MISVRVGASHTTIRAHAADPLTMSGLERERYMKATARRRLRWSARWSLQLRVDRVIPGMNWEWNINLGSFRRRMRAGAGCGWDDERWGWPLLRSSGCPFA